MPNGTGPASPGDGVRLRLQGLAGPSQVLTIGALAAMRTDDGAFATSDVTALLTELRLPPIANVSAALGRLRQQRLVMRPSNSSWSLTPAGEARVATELAHIPVDTLALDLGRTPGSQFGSMHHGLIPPALGPLRSGAGLARLLGANAFEQNVMLITRFPKKPDDHFHNLIPLIRSAVRSHGLNLMVASDGLAEDMLWQNVVTYMWACKYAVVLMDTADGVLNSNVLIEVGGMLMTGRRCAILRDISVPQMPSDLVGHIYKTADLADHAATITEIHAWIRDDLGLSHCQSCPGPPTPGPG